MENLLICTSPRIFSCELQNVEISRKKIIFANLIYIIVYDLFDSLILTDAKRKHPRK